MCASALLLVLACAAPASEETLEERLDRLERELKEERARGEAREERIRELETALAAATEQLATAADRRSLEREIEEYLASRPGAAAPAPAPLERLRIGAVIVASYRYADLGGADPGVNGFQVEDRYLRVAYRFSDAVTARYYTDGSLAEIEYRAHDLLQLNAGVVVVPFGQFNPRSFPDSFDTLSRPLLYLGDEDVLAQPENNPRPVFRSLYSDAGVAASGSLFRGRDQLAYAVAVTNGLAGTVDLGQGAGFSDNNDTKQLAARVAYGSASWFDGARLGIGASFLNGKYDAADALSYRMYGADLLVVLEGLFGGEGSVTVRGEYVFAPRETQHGVAGAPGTTVRNANRVQGAYLVVEVRPDARWMFYAATDWLAQRQPLLAGGLFDPSKPDDETTRVLRAAIGVVRRLRIGVLLKLEYAYWDFDAGAPDAHRVATQVVVPF
jgi:hypothetical protein